MPTTIDVHLRRPHLAQERFIDSTAKRKIVRAGRRGGKTTGVAILAIKGFLAGKRVLYATPTAEQIDRFWSEVTNALAEPIARGVLYKNETRHIIELQGTDQRIRAKTAWNADTLRGDYADLLIMDEWQLMEEEAWERVGAPMLVDNNGDAVFIYTPPSLRSRSVSKARDPRHAAKMFAKALADTSGRWEAFHFTSYDNPHISEQALDDLRGDMSSHSYRQEMLAEDVDEALGALWTRGLLDSTRVVVRPDHFDLIVVAIDPPGGATECGIVAAGKARDGQAYVLEDRSLQAPPGVWASEAVALYRDLAANVVVGEANYGGDMVLSTIRTAEGGAHVAYRAVRATRGKAIRAEPVVALYERGMAHHVGEFALLEDELCNWEPYTGMSSPNRLDALVWAITALEIGTTSSPPAPVDQTSRWRREGMTVRKRF
jgi:hypothetical protein